MLLKIDFFSPLRLDTSLALPIHLASVQGEFGANYVVVLSLIFVNHDRSSTQFGGNYIMTNAGVTMIICFITAVTTIYLGKVYLSKGSIQKEN